MKALLDGLKALGPSAPRRHGRGALGMLALLVGDGHARRRGDQMRCCTATSIRAKPARSWINSTRRHVAVPHWPAAAGRSSFRPTRCRRPGCCWRGTACPPAGPSATKCSTVATVTLFTEFQQKINETRAMEGELARTIRAIRGIAPVRVHLVLPRREPFAREPQDAQASVMLTMVGRAAAGQEGVQAILNLGRRRGARTASAEHRHGRLPRRLLARAGEPVGQTHTSPLSARGDPARHRTAPRARGGGNAGANPGRRARARARRRCA